MSVARSRQTPEQLVVPDTQVTVHTLDTQICPDAQMRPQAPQLPVSLVRSRHTPEQLLRPLLHDTEHTPPVQA